MRCKKLSTRSTVKGDRIRVVLTNPRGSFSCWTQHSFYNPDPMNNFFERPIRVATDVYDTTFILDTPDSLYTCQFQLQKKLVYGF